MPTLLSSTDIADFGGWYLCRAILCTSQWWRPPQAEPECSCNIAGEEGKKRATCDPTTWMKSLTIISSKFTTGRNLIDLPAWRPKITRYELKMGRPIEPDATMAVLLKKAILRSDREHWTVNQCTTTIAGRRSTVQRGPSWERMAKERDNCRFWSGSNRHCSS